MYIEKYKSFHVLKNIRRFKISYMITSYGSKFVKNVGRNLLYYLNYLLNVDAIYKRPKNIWEY